MPSSFSPPRPSMTPSPMTPAPGTWSTEISGLQPRGRVHGHDAATARRNSVESGIARGKEGDAHVDHEGDVRPQLERPAEEGIVGTVCVEQDGVALAAVIDGFLNARGVELLLVLGGE